MKLESLGTWWISSKKDPRWNVSGKGMVGGFVIPKECNDKIAELKRILGEPPDDLQWAYEKD